MKPGRKAFPASVSEMPARRISFTRRSCRARFARSTRPFAWLEFAHPDLDLQLRQGAAETSVMPCPLRASCLATRKTVFLSEQKATGRPWSFKDPSSASK